MRSCGVVGVERAAGLQRDAGVLQLGHAHVDAGGTGGLTERQVAGVRLCKSDAQGCMSGSMQVSSM